PDGNPTVQFERQHFAVFEDEGAAFLGLTLSSPTDHPVTVSLRTRDNTAVGSGPAPDYDPNPIIDVTFGANTTGPIYVRVGIVNDTAPENTEDFRVDLLSAQGATLGSPTTAVVTIVDDDTPVTVQFSQALYPVEETAGSASLTVQLNRPSRQP